jgi:hypothetical protein
MHGMQNLARTVAYSGVSWRRDALSLSRPTRAETAEPPTVSYA